MSDTTWYQAQAKKAFDKIIADLTDRAGGDWFWDPIDKETKQEIKKAWTKIMIEAFQV